MKKKFFLVALLVSGILSGSIATVASAEDSFYLPEYGTLAEHNEWTTKAITVDKVAELGIRGAGVKVAVLDSGIALNTPGINTKLVAYKDFLPSQPPLPDHGTQTASVITSEYDMATGLRGVAPDAELIVGRVCFLGSCDTVAARKALVWAIEEGAQVISMSFGGPADSMMNAAISIAVSKGVVVVSAAGNNGCQTIAPWGMNRYCKQGVISEQYSGSYTIPGLISAGAIDQTKGRASFSSWGPNLDLMAPGVNTVTYDPVGVTNGFGGTSASTPLIAGVAALVLSINPELTPQQVQAILQSTTSPALEKKPKVWDSCEKSELTNTWSCNNQVDNDFPQEYFTGAGIVNALEAVKLTQQITQGDVLVKPNLVRAGAEVTVNWSGGPADLYVNNKLVRTNATTGYTMTGGQSQSYSFQINRDGVSSEPNLLVMQNLAKPSAPIVTEFPSARFGDLWLTTRDLTPELDQLQTVFSQISGIFEYDNGDKIPCSGYSPSPPDVEKVFSFKCPLNNENAPIQGAFHLMNKYSQIGPGTDVFIANVSPMETYLDVVTTYISSDEILFDWVDVPGAKSYYYRHLPTADFFCTTNSFLNIKGTASQPSGFSVAAKGGDDCSGNTIIQSDTLPYRLLSPNPAKPSGITVKNNELTFVEFDIPNAKPTDTWRIYRSDGAVVRISAGQMIGMGMQPNENVNGKTFSYRIMQIVYDMWGEVWGVPSDPITVTIKALEAPKDTRCKIRSSRGQVECVISPNHAVDSTLIEFLDVNGDLLSSTRLKNVTETNQQLARLTANFSYAASFVRVSAITGKPNEWMRRGDSATVTLRSRVAGLTYVTL
jgi:subtilisin family serine protease